MKHAVIVAGGSGTRMSGAGLPKQFLEINGRPVIVHTIEAFLKAIPAVKIIVAVNKNQQQRWKDIQAQFLKETGIALADGGDTRFHSVKNALEFTSSPSIVAIHDAVRPVLSTGFIQKLYAHASQNGSAIPYTPVTDTIRKKHSNYFRVVNRDDYITVQTPQCFDRDMIYNSYSKAMETNFTDDASVAEAAGHRLSFLEGERNNIKVTLPQDLELVSFLLKEN